MKKRITALLVLCAMCACIFLAGCTGTTDSATTTNDTKPSSADEAVTDETGESQTEAPTTETPTEPPTTETPTTEAPTNPPEPTKGPDEASGWELIMRAQLNPKKSGYEELDKLVDELISAKTTPGANNYSKLWNCYLYFVDEITYSRGMDANVGMYSSSDPATTPTEVLWATDLLNSGQGCCYNYSAALMFVMRALGYDARLVSGDVPKAGGGRTPHCWVLVTLEGVDFTFDPDMDMNQFRNDTNKGAANPRKDNFFCRRIESWFYKPTTYYDI